MRKTISLSILTVLLGLTVWAHDDAKQEESGEAVTGSGYAGGEGMRANAAGMIGEFPADGIELLSWLTSEDLAGAPQRANDIWGYVSPAGREYAIVGLEHGTAFVDVSDPLAPSVVRFVPGPSSFWRDMAVYGEHAYTVNETGRGIQVFDLRKIDDGKVRKAGWVQDFGLATVHNISINAASGYAYLSGPNLAGGGLVAVDLSDPSVPQVVEGGSWPFSYVHDAQIVTYDQGKYAGREIAFAFAAQSGLQIIDVTDKQDMFTRGTVVYPGLSYSHSGWLGSKRKFIYLNDELDERNNLSITTTTTYVVKVKNLDKPRFVRAVSNGIPSIDHNTMIQDRFLLAANYRSGLRAFSLAKKKRPRERAYFDTSPESDSAEFGGAWGVFAAFPSRTIIVSDIERGLFVLRRASGAADEG